MCWCRPNVKTPFCRRGPCNLDDVQAFQNIVAELRPDIGADRDLLRKLTEVYAQDYETWDRHKKAMEIGGLLGQAARESMDRMIIGAIKEDL